MTALHSFQDLHGKIKEAEKPPEASRKPGRLENGADAPHSRDREMAGNWHTGPGSHGSGGGAGGGGPQPEGRSIASKRKATEAATEAAETPGRPLAPSAPVLLARRPDRPAAGV